MRSNRWLTERGEKRSCKPRHLKIIFSLPCKSEHPHPDCWKLSMSLKYCISSSDGSISIFCMSYNHCQFLSGTTCVATVGSSTMLQSEKNVFSTLWSCSRVSSSSSERLRKQFNCRGGVPGQSLSYYSDLKPFKSI